MSTVQPVRVSFGVLRSNPRLLVFPLFSGVALALVSGEEAVSAFLRGRAGWSPSALYVALGAGYLLVGFVLTLCSAAMICAVDDVLRGEPARIGASCRRALRNWPRLLAWSLLNTTVLVLLRQLRRIPVVGWLMDDLFAASWTAATYLALPAMMIDGLGVVESTRRSAGMLRETFSRRVYGSMWIVLPVVLSVVLGCVALILAVRSESEWLGVGGGVAAVLLLMCALLGGATLSGIFRTLVYRDASAATGSIAG